LSGKKIPKKATYYDLLEDNMATFYNN